MNLSELEIYKADLLAADIINDNKFHYLISGARNILGLSMLDMAKELKVSTSTIKRWANKKSAPHYLGRLSVFIYLTGKVNAKLEQKYIENFKENFMKCPFCENKLKQINQ